MGILNLSIATARPNTDLIRNFETAGGKEGICQRLINMLTGIVSGCELAPGAGVPVSVGISVQGSAAQASGTLTFVSAVATNTFVINGVTFTAIASGATGNQFNIGGSDTITAANAAAVINASVTALVSGYVAATSALGVVTVKSTNFGVYGNQVTLVGGTNITASAARLSGGAADASAVTLSF